MCMISMIMGEWQDNFPTLTYSYPSEVSREEFDALKKELLALKELLLAAKKYDDATGQRDCEDTEKVALLKRLGELVGVNVTEVFK